MTALQFRKIPLARDALMNEEIRVVLDHVFAETPLTADHTYAAISALMDGRCSEVEIAALLTALRVKGETVDEIVGAARAMRERATRIECTRTGLLDTCGTGGDQLHTFNISTATAIVAAAAGVSVAKHGNRGVSSSSGSSDVLQALGVNVQLAPEQVAACLDEVGIGFCFAPLLHGAMKHAAPVRKQLGFRTIFNLLGPLTNPAGAEHQLLGANSRETAKKLAYALAQLGRKRTLVVCGNDQLDEVSLWGETAVFDVSGDQVTETSWTCDTFGLPGCNVEQLQVDSPEASAAVIRAILSGQSGPARDIVLANTAAALIAAGHADDPQAAVQTAVETIDAGIAETLCQQLVEFTNAS